MYGIVKKASIFQLEIKPGISHHQITARIFLVGDKDMEANKRIKIKVVLKRRRGRRKKDALESMSFLDLF